MTTSRRDLTNDLILPCLLFAVLGGMTWAVRGSSGYGGWLGCTFAGVTWGTAWWFIARDRSGRQSRPYSSGWVILALTVGIAYAGDRGWMQWPHFFSNRVYTNYAQGAFEPIARSYGFIWLFIAGVPWAGLGACLLAWCSDRQKLGVRDWVLRIACGLGAGFFARWLFENSPSLFLPLYDTMASKYGNLSANPTLGRLVNDTREAVMHMGFYLGFLAFEVARRHCRNVILILTVGLLNGLGWAICQNWKWAPDVWPGANFNWWRCWESCGGISIGIALGVAYYIVNQRRDPSDLPVRVSTQCDSTWEKFGAYAGLILGLGVSIRSGLKGWINIHIGNEVYWSRVLWIVFGPLMIIALVVLAMNLKQKPRSEQDQGDLFPRAYALVWLVLIVQNILGQLVSSPYTQWNEMAFKIYYLLLFLISAVIVHYYHLLNSFKNLNPRV